MHGPWSVTRLRSMYVIRQGAHRTSMPTPPGGLQLVRVGGGEGFAVDAQAQLLPDLEEGHALGVHGDQRAGLGVAPLPRLAVLHDEAAEAADLDALPAGERL